MLCPELILLLILFGPGMCEESHITVKLPEDANFKRYTFVYMSINNVQKIDSVTSNIQPGMFDIDKSTDPNKIVFIPDLSSEIYQLNVTEGTRTHILQLNVEMVPISAIDSAVFFTGPTESVKNILSKLKSSIRLISLIPVSSSNTEASVQVLRSAVPNGFLPLWEAYDWMKNETVGSGVQLMPDRCATSTKLCRCHLTFTAGRPSVHQTVVQLNSIDNFMGFGLSWVAQTVDEMHSEACGPGTCLNGGRCDSNFRGVGFRCICPPSPNTPWGPRCEAPTRSYSHKKGQPPSFTRHWIGDLPHSSESLELSFEFAGLLQEAKETFALKSSSDLSSSLLSASLLIRESKLQIAGSMLNGSIMTLEGPQINGGFWYSVNLIVKRDSVLAVICPRNLPSAMSTIPLECMVERTLTSAASFETPEFHNLWLEMGQGFFGCIQSVAVNGYRTDLAAARITNGDAGITMSCDKQAQTCSVSTGLIPEKYACGDQSVCYGVINDVGRLHPMQCNCKCLGSKRRVDESVSDSIVCKPSNLCSKDPLIISTKSSDMSHWVLSSLLPLTLPARTTLSVEMELRTRSDAVSSVLHSVLDSDAGFRLSMQIRVSSGYLSQCITYSMDFREFCLKFPPIKVDDGEWHFVSATIRQSLLILTVDGVSSVQDRRNNQIGFKSISLTAAIAKSNLRNIRVSEIYMSTDNTDRSEDPSGVFVVPKLAADVTVSLDGVNPAPTCDSLGCPSTERCVRLWGKTSCECLPGQERNSDGGCVDFDPCRKFNITCPSNCKCWVTGGHPGFNCQCPLGVTSRLGVRANVTEMALSAPATAGFQWWIGVLFCIAVMQAWSVC